MARKAQLSKDEAAWLRTLCNEIGGDARNLRTLSQLQHFVESRDGMAFVRSRLEDSRHAPNIRRLATNLGIPLPELAEAAA